MKSGAKFYLLNYLLSVLWVIALDTFSTNLVAQTNVKNIVLSNPKAIPSNIAFGRPTLGGLGGQIIKVTNLNVDGIGSLKVAIRTRGPRIIIFEIAGVIDLDKSNLTIIEPYLTIAGQTAPSPGITIIKGSIVIKTHDILIQHIHVRPGDAGQPKKSGYEPDGLSTFDGNAYNIIIDHCSFTWGVDENLSASGSKPLNEIDSTSHKITFSNNIIAEGLFNSTHSKGGHSCGTLVNDFMQDIAIVGNLYSCNNLRNPLFKAFTKGAVINNLIYNPGFQAIYMNWSQKELEKLLYPPKNGMISVVGNVLYQGINSRKDLALISGKGDAYLEDNLTYSVFGTPTPLFSGEINILKDKPSWPSNYSALKSNNVLNYLIANVGARPKDRDEIDKRIIADFLNFRGNKIDTQNDVGGYPQYKPVYRKLTVPKVGVSKWLEQFSESVE